MTAAGDVTAIVVSYNTRDLTLACVDALRGQGVGEVRVVDNASADGSAAALEAAFGDVKVVRNPRNVGFARAVNQMAADVHTPAVLLVNPDTELPAGCVDRLAAGLDADDRVAAVAPAVRSAKGRGAVLSVGRDPTPWRMFTHFSGLSRLSAGRPWLQGWQLRVGIDDRRTVDVDWASGACLLLRTAALAQVGHLRERWFMYAEDVALGRDLRGHGWRIVHDPGVVVHHQVGASSPAGGPGAVWIGSLRDLYFTEWRPGPLRRTAWRLVATVGLASRAAPYAVAARLRRDGKAALEARRYLRYASAAWRTRSPGAVRAPTGGPA